MLLSFVAADKPDAIEGSVVPAALLRLHSSLEPAEDGGAWGGRVATGLTL